MFKNGLPSETDLINDFKAWIRQKPYVMLFANNPGKERKVLNLNISDMPLLQWSERRWEASHKIALKFKQNMVAIAGKRCSTRAHDAFTCSITSKNYLTAAAKREHGFHCALYDVFELYLYYL